MDYAEDRQEWHCVGTSQKWGRPRRSRYAILKANNCLLGLKQKAKSGENPASRMTSWGLHNEGNACFINSVLQAIANIPRQRLEAYAARGMPATSIAGDNFNQKKMRTEML